jgi:hypothetical protein
MFQYLLFLVAACGPGAESGKLGVSGNGSYPPWPILQSG